jgi:hypothetical protein
MPRATLHRAAARVGIVLILACALAAADGLPRARDAGPQTRTAQFLSKTYVVDRKYKSMLGPQSTQRVSLLQTDKPELLWVTGFAAQMVGADGEAPQSQEFMCHSNLDMNMNVHRQIFGLDRDTPSRMFTLSQGQQQIEFPKGFGIPVMSNEPFDLTTQVLNHNVEGRSIEVRHKVTVEFVRDQDAGGAMKPLLQLSANGLVLVSGEGGYFDIPSPDPAVHGPGCLPGQSATGSGRLFTDDYGRQFSGHWLVKPGREVNRSNITRFMRLPFDTTVHYIAVHLHPFAESLELRDITADKSLYLSKARGFPDKIGLDHVDYFSSEEGIPLYVDHEYELISVYNNTTTENQDSMAVMYLYVLDRQFKRPAP